MSGHPDDDGWRPGTTVTRPERSPTPEELEAVAVLRRLAHQRVEAVWRGGPQPDGTIHFPWPDYDPRVWDGLEAVQAVVGVDSQYRPELAAPGQFGPIERYTRDELASLFTWVVRGERFGDGHVNSLIQDGTLAALLDRLEETLDAGAALLEDLASRPAAHPVAPDEVAAVLASSAELTGWRLLPGQTDAPPRLAVDYAAAARTLADRIGEAAAAARLHADLTVSAERLGVVLHGQDARGFTSRDVRLARTIARLAGECLPPRRD